MLAENASDVVYETDATWTVRWVSPSVERLLGWRPEQFVGAGIGEFLLEQDAERAREVRERVRSGEAVTVDCRFRTGSGGVRWVSARGHPLVGPNGEYVGAVVGLRDCHAEVLARRAATTLSAGTAILVRATVEDELLRAMCDAAVHDAGYTFAWFGRRVEDGHRIEIAAASTEHRRYLDEVTISWGEEPEGQGPMGQSVRSGRTTIVEDFATEDGYAPWRDASAAHGFRSSITVPVVVDGIVDGALAVYASEAGAFDDRAARVLEDLGAELGYGIARLRDIERLARAVAARDAALTRGAEATRRLEQVGRLESLGQLAGGIAHDFNNLLAIVTGHAIVAARELGASADDAGRPRRARVRAEIDGVISAAERAGRLASQLLRFARRDAVEPRPLDLNTVVREAEDLLARVLAVDVAVTTELADGLPAVLADPVQMGQVLLNLAVNARDAMPAGGTLTVATARVDLGGAQANLYPGLRPGRYVQLRVTDTGTGMSSETRERAFEPFYTTRPPGEGTGLGLATVHGIVAQAGGHVSLDSEPGRGTTFTILLPALTSGAIAAPRPVTEVAGTGASARVLVVEDEDALREVTRRILERYGYRVLTAATGTEAIAAVESVGDLGLVLTDLGLPGMPGTELARRVAALRPGCRVLFMSGYAESARWPPGPIGQGAVIAKPFSEESLLRAIENALAQPPGDGGSHVDPAQRLGAG